MIGFILFIFIVASGISLSCLAMWHTDKGLPISWQQQWYKFRRSFSKKDNEYTVDIKITSNRVNSYYPFRWDLVVSRTEDGKEFSSKDYNNSKTQELAFKDATKKACSIIEHDLKTRKPKIEKTFQF